MTARRISEHRSGEHSGFTADYRCRKLIYYEHCTQVRDAIERETLEEVVAREDSVDQSMNLAGLISSMTSRQRCLDCST
jgi:hypothetical protein